MKRGLRPGIKVFHRWAKSRPKGVSKHSAKNYGFDLTGILLDVDDSFESEHRYWNVLIGKDLIQWREDMILPIM